MWTKNTNCKLSWAKSVEHWYSRVAWSSASCQILWWREKEQNLTLVSLKESHSILCPLNYQNFTRDLNEISPIQKLLNISVWFNVSHLTSRPRYFVVCCLTTDHVIKESFPLWTGHLSHALMHPWIPSRESVKPLRGYEVIWK